MTASEIANRLTNHLLLWHCTLRENAEAIHHAGFRLSRSSKRWMHREKAVYFFHSGIPFLEMITTEVDQGKCDGLFCAVNRDSYTLGRDYAHDMTNVFVFHTPLPQDVIIARFNLTNIESSEGLKIALSEQLQCNVSSTFSEICTNESIPWNQLTGIAGILRALDGDAYCNSGVTRRLIQEEIREPDQRECERLFSILVGGNQAFYRRFLDLYFGEYPFPHFGRALMVAGARFIHPIQVLALHDPDIVIPDTFEFMSRDESPVVAVLSDILPRLERKKALFGAIEMAAMRDFSGDKTALAMIESWIAHQGELAEEIAFYFISFGFDSFPIRQGKLATEMAVAALRGMGKDHFARLLHLTETDYPSTQFGLIRTFGLLKEERALPYLSSCMKDERKQIREAVVEALGRIGTGNAIKLVKQAVDDPAKSVQRVAHHFL